MIEFVTASHNDAVLYGQLMRSNIFSGPLKDQYPLAVRKGYNNIPEAYNSFATDQPLSCYIHHDVFLPDAFEFQLLTTIKAINSNDPNWGVLGVAGVRLVQNKKQNFGWILDRGIKWGHPMSAPGPVDTLDEMLLITHGDFVFDEQFPLDFYGADICMQAKVKGKKCYAISGYCEHNSTRKFGERTPSFYESEKKFREKWKGYLPIATTCALIN
jgi:hypothetical protein